MKIRNVNNLEPGFKNIQGMDAHGDMQNKPLVFQKTLTALSRDQYQTHLAELVHEIDEQGAKLSKKADIKELERYRQLIREFVNEVVSQSYSFSKENTFEARGRHRFFATVKTIDEKLDRLAKEVLEEQADSLTILHEVDDIRGLLVDMML